MPLEKNQEIELAITGMSAQGSGVGRWVQEDGGPGLAVFVPFTAVGDRIRCHIVKVQKTHAFGRLSELLEPSADRLPADEAADCAAFGRCGGCAYRHLSYEAELRVKEQRVADALKRIGALEMAPRPIVGAAAPIDTATKPSIRWPRANTAS